MERVIFALALALVAVCNTIMLVLLRRWTATHRHWKVSMVTEDRYSAKGDEHFDPREADVLHRARARIEKQVAEDKPHLSERARAKVVDEIMRAGGTLGLGPR